MIRFEYRTTGSLVFSDDLDPDLVVEVEIKPDRVAVRCSGQCSYHMTRNGENNYVVGSVDKSDFLWIQFAPDKLAAKRIAQALANLLKEQGGPDLQFNGKDAFVRAPEKKPTKKPPAKQK